MPRSLLQVLKEQKNQVMTEYAWLWLFRIVLDDSSEVRLCSGTRVLTFDGIVYQPFPITFRAITEESGGALPTAELVIANVHQEPLAVLENNLGLIDREITIMGVSEKYINDPDAKLEQKMRVLGATANSKAVTLRLGYPPLSEQSFPSLRILRKQCNHVYKGPLCQYVNGQSTDPTVDETTCDFSDDGPNGCRVHQNMQHFGGAPGIMRANGQ